MTLATLNPMLLRLSCVVAAIAVAALPLLSA